MQTILGPFHPHLENALVEEILAQKKSDSLAPLLILVPSDHLRRRLKVLLARERGLNLLNLHLLTFYQLSLRLLEERLGAGIQPPQDNSLFEELLRQMIRMRLPGAEPFAGLEETAGGSAALWQTLRDLKDGAVDPAVALEAAKSGLFGEESGESVEKLLTLFKTFFSCCEKWGLRDYADLDLMALEEIASSPYLKQFQAVFYYGFYDLTQVQLDLFQSVARQYPATLFFPLHYRTPQSPAWTFAERFYERYVHGLAGGSRSRNLALDAKAEESGPRLSLLPLFAEEEEPGKAVVDVPVTIFSCFDGREEIDTVAKEILRLVHEEIFAFDQIGVVGRALEPYVPWIKEIFARHSIPLAGNAEEPLVQYPLTKAALLLANLPLKGYLRSQVVDLFDSPFFNSRSSGEKENSLRPDLWDLATRALGISKGIEEWRRLEKHLDREAVLEESADEEDGSKEVRVPPEQLRAFWALFSRLHGDLEALPKESSWSGYVGLWTALQKRWLGIDPQAPAADADGNVAAAIEETLRRLAALDAAGEAVSLDAFLRTYQHWLERAAVPCSDENRKGVALLDAMAARGIPFGALFIIGLNEGLFPRTIREDAFLRDRERELLETVLGYKVATKLGGFDEERLLFALLAGAAGKRLYALYRRNDESGRALAPSWYLDELVRAVGPEKIKRVVVPRGVLEKESIEPFDRMELFPPEELAIRLILKSTDPAPLVEICLPPASLYRRGRAMVEELEAVTDRLAGCDGIVGTIPEYWRRISEEGLSPTSLEGYARCPFQFFARSLLRLERLKRPEEIYGPGAADLGRIAHLILKSFFQELIDRKFFLTKEKSIDVGAILKAVTEKIFGDYERNNPVGYPVAWEIEREKLVLLLETAVELDLEILRESGFQPVALEVEAKERLPDDWPSPLGGIAIRGRLDRIDLQPEKNRYRVVDYKLKSTKSRSPADKDLLRSALRGQRLQPPFYLLLGKKYVSRRPSQSAASSVEAAYYFLTPHWADGPLAAVNLPADAWEGKSGASLKKSVASLAEAIRQGLFFVQPGDYCRYCEVSEACRRNHLPTLWRVERDSRSRAHLGLREKKAE